MTERIVSRVVPYIFLLILAACARDQERLDQFSRAYTDFMNVGDTVDTCYRMPTEHESDYWQSVTGALITTAPRDARARSATGAVEAYRIKVVPLMAACGEFLGKMDTTIGRLVETANGILDEQSRSKAVECAKQARSMYTAFASLHSLYQQRFDIQLSLLRHMIANNGDYPPASSFKRGGDEIAGLVKESDVKWQQAVAAELTVRDLFSALKGHTGLKSYPTNAEAGTAKQVKSGTDKKQ